MDNAVRFDELMDYESGLLCEDEIVDMFTRLVASGQAWQLQGSYGRTARNLIECGHIQLTGKVGSR